MSKKIDFINYVKNYINEEEMPEDVRNYWEAFQLTNEKEKSPFTENGKLILKFLQSSAETEMWPAKKIAEEMGIGSRSVSGSMRRLVSDGYVEALGENPKVYKITNKGKDYIFED